MITVPGWMEFCKFKIHVKYLQAAWMCQNSHLSSQKSKGLLNEKLSFIGVTSFTGIAALGKTVKG